MHSGTELINNISQAIADDGYVVIDHAFDQTFMAQLHQALTSQHADLFKQAGIGRDQNFHTNHQIRGDQILWLEEGMSGCQEYFSWIESLRLALNQRFFLGLFEYECMFAHYPAGTFYEKHVDAFKSGGNRKVSTILYLNPNWKASDGGELLMYQPDEQQPFKTISPDFGRLVVFLSEEFPHEVKPARQSRFSLTGWFRIKA